MKNRIFGLFLPIFMIFATVVSGQEYGTASYYSDDFDGMETAYGVKYDKAQLTAAHKRHPFGTMLKVTRLDNGKSVTVKVIDKGPWIKGRVVDLSRAAAEKLELIRDGVADVKVEVASGGSATTTTAANTQQPKSATTTPKTNTTTASKQTQTPQSYDFVAPKSSSTTTATTKKTDASAINKTKTVKVAEDGNAKVMRSAFTNKGLYKIVLMQPEKKGFGVQVAALNNYENVLKKVAELQGKWFDNILVNAGRDKAGKPIYKIVLGPFESFASASNYDKSLASKHKIKGFVVDLSKM